jgi:hypothetical protein
VEPALYEESYSREPDEGDATPEIFVAQVGAAVGAGVARNRQVPAVTGLAILMFAVGCGKSQPAPAAAPASVPAMKPAPPTPIDQKRAEIGGPRWDPAWDKIVEEALPPEMLSGEAARAVRPYCPRFNTLDEADKRAFWAYLFQALAGAEAGLKPTSHVRHTQAEMQVKDEVSGARGHTEGLLQLAYEDQKRYGCDFDWEADRKLRPGDPGRTILQPRNNLECGVKIMDQELIVQHKPLLSRTQYWATLQPGTMSYRVFAKQMANVPKACGVQAKPHRRAHPSRVETASVSKRVAP